MSSTASENGGPIGLFNEKRENRKTYWLGTSGFSYDDWVGEVYPPGLPKKKWFDYYTKSFNALELNMSYYRLPSERVIHSLCRRAFPGFLLTVKANKTITHGGDPSLLEAYNKLLEIPDTYDVAGMLLLQFPYSFHYNPKNFDYVKRLCDATRTKTAVEFRNREWINADTLNWAETNRVMWVSVDEPDFEKLMPSKLYETAGIYVRFHGRNAEKWWQHERAYERYDYLYTKEELLPWAQKIRLVDKKPAVFYFNNHYKGKSVKNAKLFSKLLEKTGNDG